MSALPQYDPPTTEADYLAFERSSEFKHEFIDGEVIAMAGATESHNLVEGNTFAALHTGLRGRPCKTYVADMKVRTPSTGTYVYPDVVVACGEVQLADDENDVLLNPTLIIEVLSPSTEHLDRGKKAQRYREIASLQEYILIAQDAPHIERFLRQSDGTWLFSEVDGLDATIALTSIDCTLALADVYERVDFSPPDAPEPDA